MIANATRQSHLESLIIIKGTKNPFSDMHCVFESFPPSTVTWTRGSNRSLVQPTNRVSIINISNTQTDENVVWSNDNRDFSFTINGGIVIDELDYVDADMYYCMADNGYRTEEAHIRLRVRGKRVYVCVCRYDSCDISYNRSPSPIVAFSWYHCCLHSDTVVDCSWINRGKDTRGERERST